MSDRRCVSAPPVGARRPDVRCGGPGIRPDDEESRVRARSARLLIGGLMLATVGLTAACAGQPVVSGPGAVVMPSPPSPLAALSASVRAPMASAADIDGKPVNCGKVGPTGG